MRPSGETETNKTLEQRNEYRYRIYIERRGRNWEQYVGFVSGDHSTSGYYCSSGRKADEPFRSVAKRIGRRNVKNNARYADIERKDFVVAGLRVRLGFIGW